MDLDSIGKVLQPFVHTKNDYLGKEVGRYPSFGLVIRKVIKIEAY